MRAVRRALRRSSAVSPCVRRQQSTTCDVCIVGGGVIGSSVALQLAVRRPELSVLVVEKDPSYSKSSTALSAGGIRQQFTLAENVALSIYGAWWLKEGLREAVGDDDCSVDLVECGYLTLARDAEALRLAHATQTAMGADWIRFLGSRSEVEAAFPWLQGEGVEAACFGERNEGYFDAYSQLRHTKRGAQRRSVAYETAEVRQLHANGDVETLTGTVYSAGVVVLAAGARAGDLIPEIPVRPRKRCIFAISCDDADRRPAADACPLVLDTTGVYFRGDRNPGNFLCGVSPLTDPDVPKGEVDWCVDANLFEDPIWPCLAHRVPAFESLKLRAAWAGLYEYNTLDQNGIVGFGHPDYPKLLFSTGFSGHGLQHAAGVGRAIAELVDVGRFETIDLTRLGYDRVLRNEPMREVAIY